MPDRIFVTFTTTRGPESYHAAIHYERTDAAGKVIQHSVIEAKPERYEQLSPLDNVFGMAPMVDAYFHCWQSTMEERSHKGSLPSTMRACGDSPFRNPALSMSDDVISLSKDGCHALISAFKQVPVIPQFTMAQQAVLLKLAAPGCK